MGHVVVIGSLNHDCIAFVEDFPRPGNTVMAESLLFRFGGKGANQAVAAARQGAKVSMIGCLGDDATGASYRQALEREGINTSGVLTRSGVPTGTALICVNQRAENTIVVGEGANGTLTPEDVEMQREDMATADVLMAQFEVPMPSVVAGLKLAQSLELATCLNPSPWRVDFPWGEVALDFVIVNEHEARQLLGREVFMPDDVSWIAAKMRELNIRTLIVTRGAESTLAFRGNEPPLEIPVLPVAPIDTVGAGDCFAGVFAARWAEVQDLEPALRAASVAGSLATLKAGAQGAAPSREEVDDGLGKIH